MSSNKFMIQDNLYLFPYHYVPHFQGDGTPTLCRRLSWGFDYLCYQRHLHEKVIMMNPQSVLEVGCGDGYFLGGLPSTIKTKVGTDLSDKAIAFAKAFHPECSFFVEELCNVKGVFDVIAAIEVLEHIPDNEINGFLEATYSRLTENGKLVICVPTTVVPLNKKHYRHYTIQLLETQLKLSNLPLSIKEWEYIYTQPFWFRQFLRFYDNRWFSLEIKPLMRWVWQKIWNKFRIVDENTGFHLVAVLEKSQ